MTVTTDINIVARFAEETIVTGPPIKTIVARPAGQGIVARTARQRVIGTIPGHGIVKGRSGNVFKPGNRIVSIRTTGNSLCQINRYTTGSFTVIQGISPGTTRQRIVTGATAHHVIPGTGVNHVIASPARHRIIATKSIKGIVTGTAAHNIVSTCAR